MPSIQTLWPCHTGSKVQYVEDRKKESPAWCEYIQGRVHVHGVTKASVLRVLHHLQLLRALWTGPGPDTCTAWMDKGSQTTDNFFPLNSGTRLSHVFSSSESKTNCGGGLWVRPMCAPVSPACSNSLNCSTAASTLTCRNSHSLSLENTCCHRTQRRA